MRCFVALCVLLASCSPLANFRPASGLLPGKRLEIGAGAAVLGPRPYVDEDARGAAQIWVSGNSSPLVSLSAIGAFDDSAVALGGALRLNLLRHDRFAAGVEVEAGYAWAAVSLPFALRAFEQSWLYSAPRLGTWSDEAQLSLPLGASLHVYDGLLLRAEGQLSFQDFKNYNRRLLFGAAAAYQF